MKRHFDTINIDATFVDIVLIAQAREPPNDVPAFRHRLYQRHLLQHRGDRARHGSSTRRHGISTPSVSTPPSSTSCRVRALGSSHVTKRHFDAVHINVTFANIVAIARVGELPRDEVGFRHRLHQRHLPQHLSGRMRLELPERRNANSTPSINLPSSTFW